ncbi:uncharacterized protein M6B38_168475 [Iris pallida]|uniref:Reverse transcriptase domain-containing protein n=1 Tax=Iris pallida TaxID=29817 RepID=A0AAX6EVK4_IRIPA|nr:uncharacterized protein M6B38_168475 [Iris pallida]
MRSSFHTPIGGPHISHLAYADDVLIFTSGDIVGLRALQQVLHRYEAVSGQKINYSKSAFYTATPLGEDRARTISTLFGFSTGTLPFSYLGCPLTCGRRNEGMFSYLLDKIRSKLTSWQNKILSLGGKLVLIKNILLSIPMYTLAACCPFWAVLRTIERMFAAFFWGSKDGVAKRSWLAWRFVTRTKSEGGLGIKCLNDIMDGFSMKLWWKLMHGKGLWVELLKAKYFRKRHPCDAFMTSKCSHIWLQILRGRKLAEPFISLRLGRGEGSARCEDWIPGGPRLDSVAIPPAEGVTSRTRRGTERRTRGWSRTQARESADVEAADSTISQRVGTGELRRSARLAERRVVLPYRTVTVRVLSDRERKIRDSRARNSDNGGPAIRSFWTATGWDLSLFLGQFGVEAAGRLREANLTCTSDPDSLVWGDRKGSFTMAAAWRYCRTSHPTSSLFSNIWGKCIPAK